MAQHDQPLPVDALNDGSDSAAEGESRLTGRAGFGIWLPHDDAAADTRTKQARAKALRDKKKSNHSRFHTSLGGVTPAA